MDQKRPLPKIHDCTNGDKKASKEGNAKGWQEKKVDEIVSLLKHTRYITH